MLLLCSIFILSLAMSRSHMRALTFKIFLFEYRLFITNLISFGVLCNYNLVRLHNEEYFSFISLN